MLSTVEPEDVCTIVGSMVAGGIADEGVSSKRSALGEGNGPGE
jgi:hypothetical protein